MASTYSPALRLELMATGDQSGTWGDTTNINLGTLLEQAITGYLSVAQGDVANLTLTTVNGGSDQARNAVVEITGALTATRNVVVQTAEKLYTIKNSTTGGFSIVAKTTAGTGISIPPGASIDCYSDGTNVVAAANYWNGQIGGAVYLDAGATVGPAMDLFRDSTSPAASDVMGQVVFNGRDSAGNKQEYASIEATILDTTSTSEDGTLDLYATVAGTRTKLMSVSGSAVSPGASDGASLGTTALMWSDLFLASASVVNWDNGDVTLTHSANLLNFAGGKVKVTTNGSPTSNPSLTAVTTDGAFGGGYTLIDGSAYIGVWSSSSGAELNFGFGSSTGMTSELIATTTSFSPATSDSNALGSTSLMWSDLFLASGGVINWNNGDVTITHSSNALAFAGASSGYLFDQNLDVTHNTGYGLRLIRTSATARTYGLATDTAGSFVVDDITAGLRRLEITTGGVLNLPIGQIKFPGTQNPSSDANTLDDYEEGTWTPTWGSGGGALGAVVNTSATYTKIGNRVMFDINATISVGTATGYLSVTNLPFTSGVGSAAVGKNNTTSTTFSVNIDSGGTAMYATLYSGGMPLTGATQQIFIMGAYRV